MSKFTDNMIMFGKTALIAIMTPLILAGSSVDRPTAQEITEAVLGKSQSGKFNLADHAEIEIPGVSDSLKLKFVEEMGKINSEVNANYADKLKNMTVTFSNTVKNDINSAWYLSYNNNMEIRTSDYPKIAEDPNNPDLLNKLFSLTFKEFIGAISDFKNESLKDTPTANMEYGFEMYLYNLYCDANGIPRQRENEAGNLYEQLEYVFGSRKDVINYGLYDAEGFEKALKAKMGEEAYEKFCDAYCSFASADEQAVRLTDTGIKESNSYAFIQERTVLAQYFSQIVQGYMDEIIAGKFKEEINSATTPKDIKRTMKEINKIPRFARVRKSDDTFIYRGRIYQTGGLYSYIKQKAKEETKLVKDAWKEMKGELEKLCYNKRQSMSIINKLITVKETADIPKFGSDVADASKKYSSAPAGRNNVHIGIKNF